MYECYDLSQCVEKLVQTTLRAIIGDMGLDDTLASREEINRILSQKIRYKSKRLASVWNRLTLFRFLSFFFLSFFRCYLFRVHSQVCLNWGVRIIKVLAGVVTFVACSSFHIVCLFVRFATTG